MAGATRGVGWQAEAGSPSTLTTRMDQAVTQGAASEVAGECRRLQGDVKSERTTEGREEEGPPRA